MDFELNEDQLSFAEVAKQFAVQMLEPYAAEWDENHHFHKNVLRQ
ncbi:acyl-CoA dehydrogenase, partial [Vibrio parahaemolyticus]|nr:acyl-CoA dehydrogenase [Vibrio parahaemolyticus]